VEPGADEPSAEIENARRLPHEGVDPVVGPDRDDPVSLDRDRLRALLCGVPRMNVRMQEHEIGAVLGGSTHRLSLSLRGTTPAPRGCAAAAPARAWLRRRAD